MVGNTGQDKGIVKASAPKGRQICANFPSRIILIKQECFFATGIASLPDKPSGAVQWLPEEVFGTRLDPACLGQAPGQGAIYCLSLVLSDRSMGSDGWRQAGWKMCLMGWFQ